jgi:hypothetical protein
MENMKNKKSYDDDLGEINFVDFLIVLLKYKKMIISVPMICALIGIGYFYIAPKMNVVKSKFTSDTYGGNIQYYSECLIEPAKNFEKKINLIIFRRNFILNMLEENGLLIDIKKAIADEKKPEQVNENQIGKKEIYHWIRNNLYISPYGDVITIGFTAPEKEIPLKIIEGILFSLNNFFGRIDLETIAQELNMLNQQLAITREPELKETISEKIVSYLQDEVKIKKSKQYVFKLLDPAALSRKVQIFGSGKDRKIVSLEPWTDTFISTLNSRSKNIMSRHIIIIFLIIISSFMIVVTIAFFREYISKIKFNHPEKYAELRKYLSF